MTTAVRLTLALLPLDVSPHTDVSCSPVVLQEGQYTDQRVASASASTVRLCSAFVGSCFQHTTSSYSRFDQPEP